MRRLSWKNTKLMWRHRRLFHPASQRRITLLYLSPKFAEVLAAYEAWLKDRSTSVVPLAHAADLWASHLEHTLKELPDWELALGHRDDLLLESLTKSSRALAQAADELAIAQQRGDDQEAPLASMAVAFSRMKLVLDEWRVKVEARMPVDSPLTP